jgi:hypothetical protein
MQQWEYLFLSLTGSGKLLSGVSTQTKFRTNGQPFDLGRQVSVHEAVSYLGEQGWEMITQVFEGGEIIFTFKRPKGGV